jgi:hypothetical protein
LKYAKAKACRIGAELRPTSEGSSTGGGTTSNFTPARASNSRLRGLDDASTRMFSLLEATPLPQAQDLTSNQRPLSQILPDNAIADTE